MATYDSIHTGEQVDEAVDIVLGNKSKGSATQPIYLDVNGAAQNVNVDATPTDSSANLVQSGGVFTQLSTKYAKADISTDVNLGTSDTVISSQGAVKSYIDTHLAAKQDVVTAGDGIVKDGNTLSIDNDNDFMTVGKLDNKWNHFNDELAVGYGADLVERMTEAKHSTFDLSKFTVVGSPNISADGVASGFSDSNAFRVTVDTSSANSIEFDGSFIYTTYSSSQDILQYVNAYYKLYIKSTGNIIAHFQNSAGSWYEEIVANPANYGITAGTKVYYKMFLYKNEGYRRLYISTDGINYSLVGTVTSTNTNPFMNGLTLYYGVNWGIPSFTEIYQGSMDLKDISVKLDGVPVFSGNKTGIDTIKPDNYTVVGTPTISADGIASGFSSSNVIQLPQKTINKTFSIKNLRVRPVISADNVNQALLVFYSASNLPNLRVYTPADAGGLLVIASDGTNELLRQSVPLARNSFGTVDLDYDGTKFDMYANGVLISSTPVTLDLGFSSYTPRIGCLPNGTNVLYSEVDLNFSIYADGDLVTQPCLKIPYTQTKDGKKIVDYSYKLRVKDEYGQAGFTPYYTLDTMDRTNYTVVGSPTISSDFVASGFSSSNYLRIKEISLGNKFIFLGKCTIATTSTQYILSAQNIDILNLFISNSNIVLSVGDGTSWIQNNVAGTTTLEANDEIIYKLEYNGFTYKLYISVNGGAWSEECSITSSSQVIPEATYNIGVSRVIANPFSGSIDLKEFKIYVNDKLAYQAVIPPNYTMATVKESAIVDSYDNGMNKWTKLANLTCKQQGSCTSGTAVTFTKPYMDTNYALSVPYSAKTKTGFTPSATGDWIANGKVDLNA